MAIRSEKEWRTEEYKQQAHAKEQREDTVCNGPETTDGGYACPHRLVALLNVGTPFRRICLHKEAQRREVLSAGHERVGIRDQHPDRRCQKVCCLLATSAPTPVEK